MTDDCNDTGHHGNAYYVISYFFHQRIDDTVKHSYIRHDPEKQYGKDK